MKKIYAVALALGPLSLGVVAVACADYTSGEAPNTTGPSTFGPVTSTTGSPTTTGTADTTSAAGTTGGGNGIPLPCEVLEGAGLDCVSAHSSVRVIVPGYTGPLYQLKRASDNATMDIGTVDGFADVAKHDEFCPDGACKMEILYDQSGIGNHLTSSPPSTINPNRGAPVNASALPVQIAGRSVYGMLFRPGMGYRAACNECPYPPGGPAGTAVGDEPQTVYMVSSQEDLIDGCCFDYGNASVTAENDGNGTMEAVYLGNGVIWGTGSGEGPWAMADLENGLYAGWENGQDQNISTNTPLQYDFVTALIIGDTADKNGGNGRFAIYGGDASQGALKLMYDGIRPEKPGYVPAQKQGSVILGIGGDNTDGDGGRFYEGVMANGVASQETVDALQAAIVAAGYGK